MAVLGSTVGETRTRDLLITSPTLHTLGYVDLHQWTARSLR